MITKYDRFLEMVQTHGNKDECLLWPYAKNQNNYGNVWNADKCHRVHRLALEYKLGRSIKHGLKALHTHTGQRNCFAPAHLYEGTPLQNMIDMIADGTSNPGEKHWRHVLTTTEILEIREKWATGLYLQRELADEYKITKAYVGRIIRREKWKHI